MSVQVTVVIPAFNAASTVGEAIGSLQAQTLSCWNAIVIDDGSTDGTADVVRALVRNDSRIRLIGQVNAGASAARNTGLALAEGEWILFLDSDDWIDPTFLEKMLKAARSRRNVGAVYCGYNRVKPDGERLPQDWEEDVSARPFRSFSRGCPVVVHGIIVRRRLLTEVGGFDTSLITCEDWDLWQRVARSGAKFVGVPEVLAFYRLREGSLSTSTVQMLHDGLKVTSRSWGPDPRVPNPSPEFREGRNGDDLDGSPGYFLCWCAGEYAAQGHDCAPLIDSVDHLPRMPDRADQLADALFDGILAVGHAGKAENLIDCWPELARNLSGFLGGLERKTSRRGLARRIEMGLRAQMIYEHNSALPTTASIPVDIRNFQGIKPDPGVDTVRLQFRAGEHDLGDTQVPVWGELSREEVAAIALRVIYFRKLLRRGTLGRDPRFWRHCAAVGVRSGKRLARALLKTPNRKKALKSTALHIFNEAALRTYGAAQVGEGSSTVKVRKLIADIEETARQQVELTRPPVEPKTKHEDTDPTIDPKAFFEKLFETADPWNYTNAYETLKYQQTLGLLPQITIGRAMEVACAEGHFTRMLAPRVEQLFAVDIAQKAVDRAQARCVGFSNIDYGQFNLIEDEFPKKLDLIVCSEVLYYLEDIDNLQQVAIRMRDALAPGGRLLMAHAYQLSDNTERTGFDWGDAYGGQTISDVFEATPELKLEQALETDLYRINLFRREGPGVPAAPAIIRRGEMARPLDAEIERYVLWGGAVARRSDVESERTSSVPVLCYHRVGTDGPEALADYRVSPREFRDQMRLLRRYGYRTLAPEEVADHIATGRAFTGRPVMITFDDGYQDFAEQAWPILKRHDFTAQVFVVTDKVGQRSDWDAQYGSTSPLMGWETILDLHSEGCLFGSHLATHRDAKTLSPAELLREAASSKAVLEARLGSPIRSVAAPFGVYDDRLSYILELCGYKIAFTTDEKISTIHDDPMSMPRIEILGGTDLETFADSIGLELEDEDLKRGERWLGPGF